MVAIGLSACRCVTGAATALYLPRPQDKEI